MSQELPINAFARDIENSIKLNAITIVIGETGSGKTTQIPQVLSHRISSTLRDTYEQ